MFTRETAILKADVKKKLKVISLFGHSSPYILEANKVNSEIWRQIAQQTKFFDLKLQNLQKLILKFLWVSKTTNTLYEYRSEKDLTKLVALVKAIIKGSADAAVFLGKAKQKKVISQNFFSVIIFQKF